MTPARPDEPARPAQPPTHTGRQKHVNQAGHAPHDSHAGYAGHAGHESHAPHDRHAEHADHEGHASHDGHAEHASHAHGKPDSGTAPQEQGFGGIPQDDPRGPGRVLVVTASNRAAAGVYADTTGPLITERLRELGFAADGPRVVPDGDPVERALREGVMAGYDVIVTTGGTGISPTDRTPEATRRVIDHEVPGIAEAIRAYGREKVPTAALSRGLAGVAGRTLIVNLPGSTGGVKDGLAVLTDLLPHAVAQLRGVDHPRPGGAH